mmetsp:Transcript_31853/g.90480  ORF Transcript_31853/g.90480 Transcript_31853/m.90480 type:complete len:432 (+) Transcript_31853:703-1998(+)
MLLERVELRQPDGGGHRGDGGVEADDVVEPAVGDKHSLTGLDDLGDNLCLFHEGVLVNELLPRQQEVDVAVHTIVVVQKGLLVRTDKPPELTSLHVHMEERRCVLVERGDGVLGAQPVVCPRAKSSFAHEAREEGLHVLQHRLELRSAEEVVVCSDVVVVALAAVQHHVDVVAKFDVPPKQVLVDLEVWVALPPHLHVDGLVPKPLLELQGVPGVLRKYFPLLGDKVGQDHGDALLVVALPQLLRGDGGTPLQAIALHAHPPGEDVGPALGARLVTTRAWCCQVDQLYRVLQQRCDVYAIPHIVGFAGKLRGLHNLQRPLYLHGFPGGWPICLCVVWSMDAILQEVQLVHLRLLSFRQNMGILWLKGDNIRRQAMCAAAVHEVHPGGSQQKAHKQAQQDIEDRVVFRPAALVLLHCQPVDTGEQRLGRHGG